MVRSIFHEALSLEIFMRLVCLLMIFFHTLYYCTLSHNLIKDDSIESTFQREGSLYLACNDINAFFTSEDHKTYTLWSCQRVVKLLLFFWIIFILDLALLYTDKLWVFRWVLTVLRL